MWGHGAPSPFTGGFHSLVLTDVSGAERGGHRQVTAPLA